MTRGYLRASIKSCYFNPRTRSARPKSPYHHPDGIKLHKCFAGARQKLIILAQSSLVIHPAECALDNPSKFYDFKYFSGSFNYRPNDIVVYRRFWWKAFWQVVPLTTCSKQIKYSVHNLPHIGGSWSTTVLLRGYQGLNNGPLLVSQITLISLAHPIKSR